MSRSVPKPVLVKRKPNPFWSTTDITKVCTYNYGEQMILTAKSALPPRLGTYQHFLSSLRYEYLYKSA